MPVAFLVMSNSKNVTGIGNKCLDAKFLCITNARDNPNIISYNKKHTGIGNILILFNFMSYQIITNACDILVVTLMQETHRRR